MFESDDSIGQRQRQKKHPATASSHEMSSAQSNPTSQGFSLVEILVALTVFGALVAIAWPSFNSYKEQQRISVAVADLRVLDNRIKSYKLNNEKLPAALGDLPQPSPSDPWGRPYEYLNIEDADAKGKANMRKDKNLVPINADFDLYSMGANGKTAAPLTAKDSLDDIVRGNDGGYFGLASKY